MGASESLLSTKPQQQQQQQQSPQLVDEITTVSERVEGVDPIVERIKTLKIATPLLKSPPPSESSFADILLRKPSNSFVSGTLSPNVLFELFSMYREWQEEKAKKISQKQEEIENKIETADALAVKLRQRFNYSVASMRSTAQNLSEVGSYSLNLASSGATDTFYAPLVHQLQVEVGELKGRLTEVISNCDALCKRIAAEGPETLRSSIQPFSAGGASVKASNHSALEQK